MRHAEKPGAIAGGEQSPTSPASQDVNNVTAVNGVASLAESSSGSASLIGWREAGAAVSVEAAASGRISGQPALVKMILQA